MTKHITGTRKEWLAARLEPLEAELTRAARRVVTVMKRDKNFTWRRVDAASIDLKGMKVAITEGGASLVPYRLIVSLIATKRDGKQVRQEHVADLGAINGHLLPGFYPDAATADAVRFSDWSIAMRLRFWHDLDERLARLSNRIGDEEDKLRAAIVARIPRPTDREIEHMELGGWDRLFDGYQGIVADEQKHIARAEAEIAESRKAIAGRGCCGITI